MMKTTFKIFSVFIVLVSLSTVFVIPAHAARPYCSNCEQYMLYCCESYDNYEYYRYCPNAPTLSHRHLIETVYGDYMCMSCGDVDSVIVSQKEYCERGNMPRIYNP